MSHLENRNRLRVHTSSVGVRLFVKGEEVGASGFENKGLRNREGELEVPASFVGEGLEWHRAWRRRYTNLI